MKHALIIIAALCAMSAGLQAQVEVTFKTVADGAETKDWI